LTHNIITIETAETSKYSLLAAVQWEAQFSSAMACEISNQTSIQHKRLIRIGLHI